MVRIPSSVLGSCYVSANASWLQWQCTDRQPGARPSTKPHHCFASANMKKCSQSLLQEVCMRSMDPSSVFWEVIFHRKVSHQWGQGTPASVGPGSDTLLSVTTESLQDTCLELLHRKLECLRDETISVNQWGSRMLRFNLQPNCQGMCILPTSLNWSNIRL